LAKPSGPTEFSHWFLQSANDRKNLGSLRVPDTSFLSLGFWPGTLGAFPVSQMVSPSEASAGALLAVEAETAAAVAVTRRWSKFLRLKISVSQISGSSELLKCSGIDLQDVFLDTRPVQEKLVVGLSKSRRKQTKIARRGTDADACCVILRCWRAMCSLYMFGFTRRALLALVHFNAECQRSSPPFGQSVCQTLPHCPSINKRSVLREIFSCCDERRTAMKVTRVTQ